MIEEAIMTCDLCKPLRPSTERGSGMSKLHLLLKQPDGAEDDLFMFASISVLPPLKNTPGQ